MAKTNYESIDEYIATFPADIQKLLEQYRQIIHAAIPEAKEVISYQIPCFNLNGPVLFFSAYKAHITISSPPPTISTFKDELRAYKTSVSGFQIPYEQPIPKEIITKMAQWRAAENAKKAK